MAEPEVVRAFVTRRLLDKRRDPWEYRDEELPTKTVHIFPRAKQGTAIDSIAGETKMGSINFSGSHYDFGPGSYSLRIIRRTITIGSMASDGQCWWHLHHSREGTIDSIGFRKNDYSPWIHHGNPMEPLYALGPGTITVIMESLKGTHRIASSLEGIF